MFHSEVAGGRHIPARARELSAARLAEARTDKAAVGIVGRTELKSLFIDCNDQLAPVWQRVVRAEDPPIDVNRAAFALTELSRLLNGYDICIDDHSYLPTALVERCDRLKHIVFLGTGAGSYMNLGELAQRGIRVHTMKGYGDTAFAEHAIALILACCRCGIGCEVLRIGRGLGM